MNKTKRVVPTFATEAEWWNKNRDTHGKQLLAAVKSGEAQVLTKENRSLIATLVSVPLTSNLRWADAPGNVLLSSRITGLPKESVANVSQIVSLEKELLAGRTGKISRAKLELILAGIDVIAGR